MKRVIFVCLLTLSVCLSQPADNANPAKAEQHEAASAPKATVAPPASTVVIPQETAKTDPKAPDTPKSTEAAKDNATTPLVPAQKADNKTNNTTDDKKSTSSTITTITPPTTAKTTAAEHNGTTAAEHNGTTTVPVTEKSSTAKPTATTEKPPTLQARGFDGASFVGGIILTLGLLAIGFMGFKYYKAQTERNYHTL